MEDPRRELTIFNDHVRPASYVLTMKVSGQKCNQSLSLDGRETESQCLNQLDEFISN